MNELQKQNPAKIAIKALIHDAREKLPSKLVKDLALKCGVESAVFSQFGVSRKMPVEVWLKCWESESTHVQAASHIVCGSA